MNRFANSGPKLLAFEEWKAESNVYTTWQVLQDDLGYRAGEYDDYCRDQYGKYLDETLY